VKLLVQRIEEGGPPVESINQVLQPELIERQSVADMNS
jgi:DNA-binding LacI/PurR family transcriptional regulator